MLSDNVFFIWRDSEDFFFKNVYSLKIVELMLVDFTLKMKNNNKV